MNRADDFNRSDSTTALGTPSDGGSAWVQAGSTAWGIDTNRGYNVGGGINQSAYLESSVSDVEVQLTIAVAPSAGGAAGLCVRTSDGSNYLAAYWDQSSGDLFLDKFEAGSYTTLGSYTTTLANGDVIKVKASSDQIEVYLNGTVRIGPVTSSFNQAQTKHGLYAYNSTAGRYDDFSITDIAAGSAGRPVRALLGVGR